MDYPEPLMRAKPCPPELQPQKAKLFAKRATEAGWDVRVGVALGFRVVGRSDSGEYKAVRSVMVEARRAGRRVQAVWVGPPDGSKMSFDWARIWPGRLGIGDKVAANDLVEVLK